MQELLAVLILWLIWYLVQGPLPWQLAKWQADYPGPDRIQSQASQEVDYLCIHGATVDARCFGPLIDKRIDVSFLALSLSDHHKGPHLADPSYRAPQDLIHALQNTAIKKGIIAHSTALPWLSEAYKIDPKRFKNKPIILLNPNLGHVVLSLPSKLALTLSPLFPNPFLKWGPSPAFKGGDTDHYNATKACYMYQKKSTFISVPYYKRLLRFVTCNEVQTGIESFLSQHSSHIKIYLSVQDKVLVHDHLIQLANTAKIPVHLLPNTSHHGILLADKEWLC